MPATTQARRKTASKAPAKPAAKRATKRSAPRDAIALLKADHAAVKKMYQAYQELVERKAVASKRKRLASEICQALTLHATAEEEIFYTALRKAQKKSDADIVNHADVEHASAKSLIAQIEAMDANDRHYDAKVCVLCEYVAHHVKEEEGEMFPKARKTNLDLVSLGEQIQARKDALAGHAA